MTIGVPPHGLLATASHREEETSMGCLRATMAATLLDGQHWQRDRCGFANATLPIYLCVSTLSDRIDGYQPTPDAQPFGSHQIRHFRWLRKRLPCSAAVPQQLARARVVFPASWGLSATSLAPFPRP